MDIEGSRVARARDRSDSAGAVGIGGPIAGGGPRAAAVEHPIGARRVRRQANGQRKSGDGQGQDAIESVRCFHAVCGVGIGL